MARSNAKKKREVRVGTVLPKRNVKDSVFTSGGFGKQYESARTRMF